MATRWDATFRDAKGSDVLVSILDFFRRIRRTCMSGILGRGHDENWPNWSRMEVRWQEQEETTCGWNGIAVLRRILLVILGNRKAHVQSSGFAGLCGKMAAVLSRLRIDAVATGSRILSATRATSRCSPIMATFERPMERQWGATLGASLSSLTDEVRRQLRSHLSMLTFIRPVLT